MVCGSIYISSWCVFINIVFCPCYLFLLWNVVLKCLALLPHNHYCCLLPSPVCLPHLLICTCLISSPIVCPPSSVLCWCLLCFFCYMLHFFVTAFWLVCVHIFSSIFIFVSFHAIAAILYCHLPCFFHAISGSHACRDFMWPMILDAELYTTCSGEWVLVAIRFNVAFLPLKPCYEKTHLFLESAESLTTYGCVLWWGQIMCSSLVFEHCNCILLCEWVLDHCSVCLIDVVSCHNAFAFYLALTSLGIGALLCSSVVTSATCLLTIVLRMYL